MQHQPLRDEILALVRRYAEVAHTVPPYVPGLSAVPVSGKVYGAEDMATLVDCCLDFWLTTGRYNDRFEAALAGFLGVKHVLTTNSGSSANLLALASLTSPHLGKQALGPGDEVITVAAGFPTTVNPILQYGLVPVFVDIEIPGYNIDPAQLESAVSPRTRAIMLAHTLGNPFDVTAVRALAARHGLWLIEDCCDALGTTYEGAPVGGFGDIATLSFYPAHHITTGEGGAVFTRQSQLRRILESMRDWGRDCWCAPGRDDTCAKRFGWTFGNLPAGYDHKYVYTHAGYNLKMTDMQAAVGCAQMARLPDFVAARKANFAALFERLAELEDVVVLPRATPRSVPSWFGFPLTLRADAPIGRTALLRALAEERIGTRLLFAGNLVRQPYMTDRVWRAADALPNSDIAAERTFWIGVYPGLTAAHLDHAAETITRTLRQ